MSNCRSISVCFYIDRARNSFSRLLGDKAPCRVKRRCLFSGALLSSCKEDLLFSEVASERADSGRRSGITVFVDIFVVLLFLTGGDDSGFSISSSGGGVVSSDCGVFGLRESGLTCICFSITLRQVSGCSRLFLNGRE